MEILSFTVGVVATQCYLVIDRASAEAFIIDPGDDAKRILETVEKQKVRVKYVILTHGHFDHTMAASEITEKTGAKLVVGEYETKLLDDPYMSGFEIFGVKGFKKLKADILVNDGDKLEFAGKALEIIHTPGHTQGGICIKIDDIIFTGDTIFRDSCGRCDLPDGNYATILQSLKRLADMQGDYRLYPGHGEPTTLSEERRYNPYLREASET